MPLTLAVAEQWLPFPHIPSYIELSDKPSDTVLDVYVDHLCSYSASVFPELYAYW